MAIDRPNCRAGCRAHRIVLAAMFLCLGPIIAHADSPATSQPAVDTHPEDTPEYRRLATRAEESKPLQEISDAANVQDDQQLKPAAPQTDPGEIPQSDSGAARPPS